MKTKIQAGIALAAIGAVAALSGQALAADLGGSMKDGGGYVAPMPEIIRGGAGPCYYRADVGYSFAQSPEITWPVNNDTYTVDANNNVVGHASTFVTDQVTNTSRENGVFGEFGMGCGSGSRGLRGEVMFGFRGDRKVDGEPGIYSITYVPADPTNPPNNPDPDVPAVDDPLHSSIRSYTMMMNVYKDLGKYGNITPYVGAGVGAAYHMVGETYFTGNYDLPNRIEGDNDLSFAWSLMAGVGYQVSDRAILDFGYRYIDMGEAGSGRVDNAGAVNPRVQFDDLTAHEIKVGLRYHFGGNDCCAAEYVPMK
ncbi:MAG: outer membrane beta-barrel protein [Hyphomicrobium sp.]